MEAKRIDELIGKYNEGLADPDEVKQLEALLEAGLVDLTSLRELHNLNSKIQKLIVPQPSLELDTRFYKALADEKKAGKQTKISIPTLSSLWPRIAAAAGFILVGFMVGYWTQSSNDRQEVSALTEQVSELKEMMMLSLLEKESASQRLRAVSLTSEMDQVSSRVTDALFTTLNQDENVNVRLAALEALTPYVKQSQVRTGLIESIGNQNSPLVQIALAELMVSLQEKKSVDALKELMQRESTPKEVKKKISESINVLI